MRYKINFASYDKKKAIRQRNLKFFLFLVSLLLFFLFFFNVKKLSTVMEKLNDVQKKNEELVSRKEKLLEERRRIFSDEEIRLLNAKLSFYEETFSNKLSATAFLNILEEHTPPTLSLKSLDFDSSRKTFLLSGDTLNPQAVSDYLAKLQRINFLKKVEIVNQSLQRFGEKKILVSEFQIRGEMF